MPAGRLSTIIIIYRSVMDFVGCKEDKQIQEMLSEGESILLSALVYKYNHVNKRQQRILLVTSKGVYNIAKPNLLNNIFSLLVSTPRLKRRIGFENVFGMTVSRYGYEFIVHVTCEHDYRYSSTDHKQEIVEVMCEAFCRFHKKKMAFFFKDDLSLSKYCTTKVDIKDKVSKLPKQKPQYLDPESLKNNENSKGKSETIFRRKEQPTQISIESFLPLKVLGKGAFGKVMLCQLKGTDELYAIKSMRKENLIEKEQIEKTKTERKILEMANHPFLISLEYSFQTKEKLFFVMRFVRGGELFQHLYNKKRFSEELAKFYASQLILALEYLHAQGFIYRDLKPENVLIGDDGYIVVTDFGMARQLQPGEKAYSFAGTPEYIAPEIIKSAGHNALADWWSLGTLIYEMLTGAVPFYNKNQNILFNNILEKQVVFREEDMLSDNAKALIKGLLVKVPDKRLGAKSVDEIKVHPWFKGVVFEDILAKKVKPPFVPKLLSNLDVTNFGKEFTEEEPVFSFMPTNMYLVSKFESEFEDMDFNTKASSK